jgi:hypothetical protein
MWLVQNHLEQVWDERRQDMQREAAQMRLVALALAGRQENRPAMFRPRRFAGEVRNALRNLRPQQPVTDEPCCVPAE